MTDFSEKVLAGASYLDVAKPGWAEHIDVDSLDLGSTSHCVIGQTMGSYIPGIAELGLNDEIAYALGFNTPDNEAYEDLTAAWIPQITQRQPKPPLRHEIKSNYDVTYVVEVPLNDYNPVLRREAYSGPSQVQVGTSDTRVWREIGQAFIDLADEKDTPISALDPVQSDLPTGFQLGD